MEVEKKERERRKNERLMYLLIIGILSILCAILAWQYWEQKQRANREVIIKEKVFVERDNVKADLVQLQQEYATLQTNDETVKAELETKKAEIAKLIIEAEKNKDNKYIIAKLRKETETLRTIMKGFVVTIDSLNTLNITLKSEKAKVIADLSTEQGKTQQLTKEKEDLQGFINTASVLNASNIRATGVKFRSGGKKEDETNKARKAEKLKIIFDLGENKVAKKGNHDIFVRVMTPDGKELTEATDESHMFKFNNGRGFYAAKETVSYDNSVMSVKTYAGNADGFIPGKYIIEIYSDEAMIGQTNFSLQ